MSQSLQRERLRCCSLCCGRPRWTFSPPAQEGLTCSALACGGGLTIRHIKTAASAALYSIQLDSEVVTASWPEIETLITDPEQSESFLNNPQDWSFIN